MFPFPVRARIKSTSCDTLWAWVVEVLRASLLAQFGALVLVLPDPSFALVAVGTALGGTLLVLGVQFRGARVRSGPGPEAPPPGARRT